MSSQSSNVRERSLWQSFAVLPKRTRLIVSGGFIAVGLVGLQVSDWLEDRFPASPSAAEKTPGQQQQQQQQEQQQVSNKNPQ